MYNRLKIHNRTSSSQIILCVEFLTFKGFATYVTTVRPPLLVPAGDVANKRAFLREAVLAELTAEGALTRVGPVVLV
jgi:hypothetical protein